MSRHKHADLIHAWAEGAEIEVKTDDWRVANCPSWNEQNEYRIKPKEPAWYENIPPHGVLCWDTAGNVRLALHITDNRNGPFITVKSGGGETVISAGNLTPLTNDEIRQFLRAEQ